MASGQRQEMVNSKGKSKKDPSFNQPWSNSALSRSSASSPLLFNSFQEMFRALFPISWASNEPPPVLTVPWQLQPTHATQELPSNALEAPDPVS